MRLETDKIRLSTNLINYLSEKYETVSEALDALNKYDTIQTNIKQYRANAAKLKETYEDQLNKINIDIVDQQAMCDHPIVSHHSGGYDRYSECDICGQNL